MNKLIIVSEYFYPSEAATAQLVTDLSLFLARSNKNYDIHILTTSLGGTLPSIHIHRLVPSQRTTQIIDKVYKAVRFFFATLYWLLKHYHQGDVILIVSNPPFIVSVGLIAKILKGAKYVFVFQDLFPQSACLAGILPHRGLPKGAWTLLFRICLKSCSKTIVLSSAMQRKFHSEYGSDLSCQVIHNWSPVEAQVDRSGLISKTSSRLYTTLDLSSKFVVQYSGNFGRMHELITLLEAARILQDDNIHFLFIGDGAKKDQILSYKNSYHLNNITILPYQDRDCLVDSLAASDISVVSLIPGADSIVAPSKFYGILSVARPILLIGQEDSDLAHIINSNNCGYVVMPGDVHEIVLHIRSISRDPELLDLMGRNARSLYQSKYSRSLSCRQYESAIAQASSQ